MLGVLWGTGIYLGMWEGGGTGGTVGHWGYWGYLGVIVGTGAYSGVLGVLWGYCRYNCGVLLVTMGYFRYCRYWVVLGVLGGIGWF